MSPKVSVIIPVYNAERFITETVESALNQTYEDLEIIILDDGSTDNTAETIKSFDDKRIIYIYQDNQGLSAARNKAISQSRGEYIALLDHDDLWLPEKLDKQIPILDNNPEIGLIYCDCDYIDAYGNTIAKIVKQFRSHRGNVLSELFLFDFIPCLTAVMRKEILRKAGFFDPKFCVAEEYDLFLRIARSFKVEYVDLPLAKCRIHEGNFSRNVILLHQEEIEILSKYLEPNSEVRKALGKRVDVRLAELHYALGRLYQLKRKFPESRMDFLSSIKYSPFNIKSYICYLSSLLNIIVPIKNKFGSGS